MTVSPATNVPLTLSRVVNNLLCFALTIPVAPEVLPVSFRPTVNVCSEWENFVVLVLWMFIVISLVAVETPLLSFCWNDLTIKKSLKKIIPAGCASFFNKYAKSL